MPTDRDSVSGDPLDVAAATTALRVACDIFGFDPAGAELIRLGSNAVFRLASAPVILRIARHVDGFASAERQVEAARWLVGHQVPSVVAVDVIQPVVAAGRVVTAWVSVSDAVAYGTTSELGTILRQLHGLPEPPFELPAAMPTKAAEAAVRIGELRCVDAPNRVMLADRYARLVQDAQAVRPVLPQGVIHGDANVGNLLRRDDGVAVLSDLDSVAIGPREWDLIQTAIYYERFGWHTDEEYAAFVDAYGFDVLDWSGYPTFADLRETSMVVWLAGTAETDPTALPELATRLKALRENTSRRTWKPR
jgi:aminoglycoside phosphotransferase (APT) family kinase protein